MKTSRRILALVMAMLMAFGSMAVVSFAADAAETEPNDDYNKANELKAETAMSAALSAVTDVDWFKFTPTADGKVGVTFAHDEKDSDDSFFTVDFFTFEKAGDPKNAAPSVSSKGRQTTSLTSIAVKANVTYFVRVGTSNAAAAAVNYSVKFGATEDDDTIAGATALKLEEKTESKLSSAADIDWFKFTSTGDKLLNVEFTHLATDETASCYKIEIYDANQKLIASDISCGTQKAVSINNIDIESGTYYIAVTAGTKYSAEEYQIYVQLKDAGYTKEKEDNNTADKANILTVAKPMRGNLSAAEDIADYFSITATKKSLLVVTLEHTKTTSAEKLFTAEVLSTDGATVLATVESKGTDAKVLSSGRILLVPGKYYIRVTGKANIDYMLTADLSVYEGEEAEPNNDINTANTVIPASSKELKVYLANLADKEDVDCYKFTLAKRGYIYIHFNEFDAECDTVFDVAVSGLTSGSGLVEEVPIKNFRVFSGDSFVKSPCIGLDAGTYYVTVSTTSVTGGEYSIAVQKGEFEVYEVENNDTSDKANRLLAGTDAYAITAASFNGDDVDWFTFPYDGSKSCTVTFSRSYTQAEINEGLPGKEAAGEWVANIYSAADLTTSIKSVSFTNDPATGTKSVDVTGLPSGTYYVKIIANPAKLCTKDYLIAVRNSSTDLLSRWQKFVARIKAIDWSGFWKNFEFAKNFDLEQVKSLLKHAIESLGVIIRAVIGKSK